LCQVVAARVIAGRGPRSPPDRYEREPMHGAEVAAAALRPVVAPHRRRHFARRGGGVLTPLARRVCFVDDVRTSGNPEAGHGPDGPSGGASKQVAAAPEASRARRIWVRVIIWGTTVLAVVAIFAVWA